MKSRKIFVFIAVATMLAAVAQAQYTPSLMPRLTAHPAVTGASINAKTNTDAVRPPVNTACTYSFTVPGKLNSFLSFCVSPNGNIVSLQSPTSNFDQIAQGGVGEGYGVCDTSTNVAYTDWGYTESGNWGAPTLVSSTASAVKIARTTTDGLWTLTQTIAKQAGIQPFVHITMALKNNTGISKDAYLVRWADIDPAAAPFTDSSYAESVDSSQYAAWAYAPLNNGIGENSLGVTLAEIGQPNVPYGFEGLAQASSVAPNPCNPGASYSGLKTGVDASVSMFWVLVTGPQKTGIVNAKYEPF